MMDAVGRIRLALLAGLGAWAGCPGASEFQCSDDDQCQTGEAFGTCQVNGFCSFKDPDCDSGERYGDNSGSLAGQCVDLAGTTGSVTETTTAEPTTSTNTPGESDGTTAAADPATTSGGAEDAGTTLGSSDGADDTETGTQDGSTGVAAGPCTEVFVDEFDDGEIGDPWVLTLNGMMSVMESGGQLRFGLVSDSTVYSWIDRTVEEPGDHRFWAQMGSLLPSSAMATADTCLRIDDHTLCFYSDTDKHSGWLLIDDVGSEVVEVEADPATSLFVGVRFDGTDAVWEVSGDGMDWQTVHTEPTGVDLTGLGTVVVGGGTYGKTNLPNGSELAVAAAGLCAI